MLTVIMFSSSVPHSAALLAWAHGWSISRGRPLPVEVPGGVRIDLGHAGRYVFSHFTGFADMPPAGTEVKTLAAYVWEPGWAVHPRCQLMTTTFTPGRVLLPYGYATRLSAEGPVTVAEVVAPDGRVVSSGRLAAGVVDRVETAESHRRRGLATVVMTELANHADLKTGLLSATEAGVPLYRALGWTPLGPLTGATWMPQ